MTRATPHTLGPVAVAMLLATAAVACTTRSEHIASSEQPLAAQQPASPPAEPTGATASPPQPPGPADYLALLEAAAALHVQHRTDCAALAGALPALENEHAAVLALLADADAGPGLVHETTHDEQLTPRFEAAMIELVDVGMACRNDAAYTAARQALLGH